MAKNEVRDGAQGLSNDSRESNKVRYDFGRLKYHATHALEGATDEERETLGVILDCVDELCKERKLSGGEEAEALITKGKKARTKEEASQ